MRHVSQLHWKSTNRNLSSTCQRTIYETWSYKSTFTWIIVDLKLLNPRKLIFFFVKFHRHLNKSLEDHGFAFLNWFFSAKVAANWRSQYSFLPILHLLGHVSIKQVSLAGLVGLSPQSQKIIIDGGGGFYVYSYFRDMYSNCFDIWK